MLVQRILTASVLLIFLLPALYVNRIEPFALLTLVAVSVAAWEWARLNDVRSRSAIGFGMGVAALCLMLFFTEIGSNLPLVFWQAVAFFWVLGGALVLSLGMAGWSRIPRLVRVVLGGGLLAVAWLSLVLAKTRGLNFILSVFCLVWVADVAAYIFGRQFGRHKLAPHISPGKTWEGALGAALVVVVMAVVWCVMESKAQSSSFSLFGQLSRAFGTVGMCLVVAMLSAMCVVGDLIESLVKRSAGVKDSSAVLPGHGGVLDRVDALLPTFPLAWGLSIWIT
jgi:phosphatidate cytidylyltransferase